MVKQYITENFTRSIFNEFAENSLGNQHRAEDLSAVEELLVDWVIETKPTSRIDVENKIEEFCNEILHTTF